MARFTETFTAADATTLQALDAGWQKSAESPLDLTVQSNTLDFVGGNFAQYAYTSFTPTDADYVVGATVQTFTQDHNSAALSIANNLTAQTNYSVRWQDATRGWVLARRDGRFSQTDLAEDNTNPVGDFESNPPRDVTLSRVINGAQVDLEVIVDGVTVITFSDSTVDRITEVGLMGIESNFANDSGTLAYFDDVYADDDLAVAAASIDTSPATLLAASTGNTITVSNFAGSTFTVTLTDGTNTTAATNVVHNAGTITFDVPTFNQRTQIAACPLSDSNLPQIQISVSDGTDTVLVNTDYQPEAGFNLVSVQGALTGQGYLYENFTLSGSPAAPLDDSLLYYPSGEGLTIAADGLISGSITSDKEIVIWDIADANIKPFELLIPTNAAPIAEAGPNQTVDEQTVVTLDGSGSSDADVGDTLTYAWTQTQGTVVTLSDDTAANPTFTAPDIVAQQDLVFSLVVNDGTVNSVADTVTITVDPVATPNVAPVANAGSNQTVTAGSTVNLSGTATDSDGTIASYAWTQTSGTSVTLNNAGTQNASFTAPIAASQEVLTFSLEVTDDDSATDTDTVSITVQAQIVQPQGEAAKITAKQVNSNTEAVLTIAGGTSPGVYQITAKNGNSGSFGTATLTIT